MNLNTKSADIIVIGGGIIGAAVAYGLQKAKNTVVMLDEGDIAFRAALSNFGLIWFQGKGLGKQNYVEWCLEATQKWPQLAAELIDASGIDVAYQKTGGLALCHTQTDLENRKFLIQELRGQGGGDMSYDCDILSHQVVQDMLPNIRLGENIAGATYSPHDGCVNPLYLLKALHQCFQQSGGSYLPNHKVEGIIHDGDIFSINAGKISLQAPKIVVAAGNGSVELVAMLGVQLPIRPELGQLLVTERIRPVLPITLNSIRQTAEGSIMLGASHEDSGFDVKTSTKTTQILARKAVNAFPDLAKVKLMRCWGGLRVLSPDKLPIYFELENAPGAYVVTSHSGVSLCALHVTHIPVWIAEGKVPDGFESFDLRRFDVQNN